MNDQLLWFATRGAGIVSLLLLTFVTCLGILTVVRWQSPSWPRFLSAQLHRNVALLSIAFLVVHVVTAIVDPYTSLGLAAAAIPFASSYRPLWVGIGVISMDLAAAVVVTSLMRERLGQRAWRLVHWLTYGAWVLAVVHGLGSGTDALAPWMLGVQGLCVAVVAGAIAWRMSAGATNRQRLADVAEGRDR
jgi:sulfoxide reductase heme-binding subunit YedZ